MSNTNKQLLLGNKIIQIGDTLDFPDVPEGGVVVGIDYDLDEVYVTDYREGWTYSAESGTLGNLKFVQITL